MSNSDDKKEGKTDDQKSPESEKPKPVKRSRKRQASRPPTIDVEAVPLDAETEKKVAPEDSKQDKPDSADISDEKPDEGLITGGPERFGYRALALSAGIGATASIVLFAGVFGTKIFSSDQKNIEDKITVLSGKVENLGNLASKAQDSQINNEAIKVLKQQLEELKSRPEDLRFGTISKQIKSIETAMAKPQNPAINPAELKNLSDKLNALAAQTELAKSSAEKSIQRSTLLEEAVKAAGKTLKGTTDGTQGSLVAQNLRLAGFEAQIKRLSEGLESLQGGVSNSVDTKHFEKIIMGLQEETRNLEERILALDGLVAQAKAAMAASNEASLKIDRRLAALEQVDRSDNTGRLAAISFAIEGLVRKIETGGAFKRELKVVTAAIPQNKQLEKLNEKASSGVKTVAQLQSDFPPVLRAILGAENKQTNSGVVSKLFGGAKSLIRIRRVGEIEGNSREAVIARLEARVKAGDLKAALAAAKKLEGAPAKVAQVWIQAVDDRLMTIELVKKIRDDIIANLGSIDAKSATKE